MNKIAESFENQMYETDLFLVYSYYVMDILNTGHIEMLRNAKSIAGPNGKVIVGILTDDAVMEKKVTPILSFKERFEIARSIKYCDLVVCQDTYSPIKNIQHLKPNVLLESTSHSEEHIESSRKAISKIGGKLITIPYLSGISSSEIKKRIIDRNIK